MPALKTACRGLGQDSNIQRRSKRLHTPSTAMITKTTKITIETEPMSVVRRSRTFVAWCPKCKAEMEVMLCEDTSVAQLLGGIRAGSLHVWRPEGSSTQICLPSLMLLSQPSEVEQVHIPEQTLTNKGEGQ